MFESDEEEGSEESIEPLQNKTRKCADVVKEYFSELTSGLFFMLLRIARKNMASLGVGAPASLEGVVGAAAFSPS
jgi:hypothetical protein